MTTTRYFTLTSSDSSLSKRFRVLTSGYTPTIEKTQTVRKTLDGNLDISQGDLFTKHDYVIRVRENEPDSDYGDKADILTFFSYNNPNGTPSDKLTFTDHFGNTSLAVFGGELSLQPLGVMLEGEEAWYTFKALFLLLPGTEVS